MKILDIHCFKGRNIYSHKPVIKSAVELFEMYDTPTVKIEGFNEKLLNVFPGLSEHCCSCGHEGGFVQRLKEGTYLAHVTEHVTLELQNIVGYEVHFGNTRISKDLSIYNIIFEYVNEKLAVECLIAAVNIINMLIKGDLPEITDTIKQLKKVDMESSLGPSTMAIFKEAKKRGIPVTRLGNESILRLGNGKYTRYLEASLTDKPNCLSIDIAGNKHLTKSILYNHGIPVPYGDIAYTKASAAVIAAMVGYPVVVKPFDANQGKGVTLDISKEECLNAAFDEAVKFSKAVIVEGYIKGKDYRLLVVGGKVAAASERKPPSVKGDGIHSIKELIEIENKNPLRGNDHEKPLTKIKLDDTCLKVIGKKGYDADSVPIKGEKVHLRENGNLSTGGTARDCTDEVHPLNCGFAVKSAELLGLDIAGVDITTDDISIPISEGNGAIIEVNAAPGLRMHLYPTAGSARNVAGDIIDMLYPESRQIDIEIVSVTGTNGKTTVTRLIAHGLAIAGKKVGMTTTSGTYVNGECIRRGDNTGPMSAETILSDERVEAAVLETARGGLIRKGLGYNLADVGIVLNISDDHLGIDGIETLEELAFCKALVVEAVKKPGYAILNADDAMTPYLLGRINCKAILFTAQNFSDFILKHIEEGGRVLCVKNDAIYINQYGNEIFIIRLNDIPITFNKSAKCNIENSLACAAALSALGIPISIIRNCLKSFKPDSKCNPGRFNVIRFNNFSVVLDYAHNPAGYAAVSEWLSALPATRHVGVIGMPGDRSNSSIIKVGRICSEIFSYIYIKEDKDLRGRKPGETAEMLYDSIRTAGHDKECVEIECSETKALEKAILSAQEGDVITVFYEDYEETLKLVNEKKNELELSQAGRIEAVV